MLQRLHRPLPSSAATRTRLHNDNPPRTPRGGCVHAAARRGTAAPGGSLLGRFWPDLFGQEGAVLRGADLSRSALSRARMPRVDLTSAALAGADLRGALLARASLVGADLEGVDLSEADLSFAKLDGANLSGADLSRARLVGAELRQARLAGARLVWADLQGAILEHAVLDEANLARADLGGAVAVTAQRSGASGDTAGVSARGGVVTAGIERRLRSIEARRGDTSRLSRAAHRCRELAPFYGDRCASHRDHGQ